MKKRKITRESLEKLAATMPILGIREQEYYWGGSLQSLIDDLISSHSCSPVNAFSHLGSGIGGALSGYVTVNGVQIWVDLASSVSSSNPNINSCAGGESIDDGSRYIFKFGNTNDKAYGIYMTVSISQYKILEPYFSPDY